MRIRLSFLLMLVLSTAPTLPSTAADNRGDRFALVIGNARYPDADAPLKEPVNDAREISDELKRVGFNVEVGENLDGNAMRRAFEHFYERIKAGSVALVFFSGFAVQSNSQSFLLPVDAQIWTEADVRRDGINLETVLAEIHNRGAGVKIALLDASRRNPFERRFRSFSAGLSPVVTPNGTLVMYSAALSSVVGDNDGEHSPFVRALLNEIRIPGVTAGEMLTRTRAEVAQSSHGEQVPWISSSLGEAFSFIPGEPGHASAARLPAPAASLLAPAPISGTPAALSRAVPSADALVPPPAAKPRPAAAAVVTPAAPASAPASAPPAPRPVTATPVAPAAVPSIPKEEPAKLALADDPTVKSLTAKITENPDDDSSLYRRGQVYAAKGAYELAIKDFTDSLRLNPKDVEAYNNRCWTRAVIGDLQAALKDCNEALRLRPNFVDALDSRGLVNLKNGQSKNAIIDFDAALGINPRLTSSLYGRGLAKQRSGDNAGGDLDIANAKAMDPNIVKEFSDYGVR